MADLLRFCVSRILYHYFGIFVILVSFMECFSVNLFVVLSIYSLKINYN